MDKELEVFLGIVRNLGLFDETDITTNSDVKSWDPAVTVTLSTAVIKICLEIYTKGDLQVCGHTDFKVFDSWYTFDRRGIEDSFYAPFNLKKLTDWDVEKAVLEQFIRAEERIAVRTAEGDVVAKLFGFSFTAPQLAQLKKDLQEKGKIFLRPAGMGTAYNISPKRKSRWDKMLTKEQTQLLGYSTPLFAESVDWD